MTAPVQSDKTTDVKLQHYVSSSNAIALPAHSNRRAKTPVTKIDSDAKHVSAPLDITCI